MSGIRVLARIYDFNMRECRGYSVIDTNTGRIISYTLDSIKMYLQSGNALDNMKYNTKGDCLECTDGDLDKLPTQYFNNGQLVNNPKDNMSVAILEKHIYKVPKGTSSKGYLVNYRILKSNGEIFFIGENDLLNLVANAGLSFTNARIFDGLNGRRTILPSKGKFREEHHNVGLDSKS